MYKRILVTLDGSELAAVVIPHVEVVAEAGYSEVILLHVAPEAEVQLVRIVQEALHNIRKHAGARIASVRLRRDGEAIVLVVEDDGAGFDPAAPAPDARRHFGLATMRERAESLGGALTLDSVPGVGTRVTVRIPLTTALAIGTR